MSPRTARLTSAFALVLSAAFVACSPANGDLEDGENSLTSDGGKRPDGGGVSPEPGACEGPLGKPVDPTTLPSCCPDHPGNSHCVSGAKVPAQLQSILGKCDDGAAVCVPDDFISTGGVFTPKTCKAFGGDGRCVSLCVPEVKDKEGLLLQDVCGDDEKCVPCISPLDKKPTGVCDLVGRCNGADAGPIASDSAPVDAGPAPCPHTGPPVLEPSTLPSCQCGDSHCVPKGAVPSAVASKLSACSGDATGLCVPDTLIESGGDFVPETCASIGGAEGRCLSTCLPDVAAQAASLPQGTCALTERCVPCYDPFSLAETGACRLSCDPGPTAPPKPLPKCCKDRGTCVPGASVPPASASSLVQDSCPAGVGDLCVPDAFLKKTWSRIDCTASIVILPAGPGVCMPECIHGMSSLLAKGACPDGMKCAPCKDPLTGKDTGACSFSL